MTPFGIRMREIRAQRGIRLKDMAEALGVSGAYLSALEHGRRGRPTHAMVVAICAQLGIIWDEADELMRLARISHPRITVDTAGLSSEATELANLLAERIRKLGREDVTRLLAILQATPGPAARPRLSKGGLSKGRLSKGRRRNRSGK